MDRLIWVAWRAFWVGLGASAVVIAQSLATPAAPPPRQDVPPAVDVPASFDPPYAAAVHIHRRRNAT